jgi:hypothetical protein
MVVPAAAIPVAAAGVGGGAAARAYGLHCRAKHFAGGLVGAVGQTHGPGAPNLHHCQIMMPGDDDDFVHRAFGQGSYHLFDDGAPAKAGRGR